MVAPLAAAAVTFTRSLPESSATVIVGARRGNGGVAGENKRGGTNGDTQRPGDLRLGHGAFVTVRQGQFGNEFASFSIGAGQVAPSHPREASTFQNFCDRFVRTRDGLTNDPLPFPLDSYSLLP